MMVVEAAVAKRLPEQHQLTRERGCVLCKRRRLQTDLYKKARPQGRETYERGKRQEARKRRRPGQSERGRQG